MLEDYFSKNTPVGVTQEQKQRLLAVQAALGIAAASVSAASANTNSTRVEDTLKGVASSIGTLADSIQAALEVK